jgi:hypothetical protein
MGAIAVGAKLGRERSGGLDPGECRQAYTTALACADFAIGDENLVMDRLRDR